MCSEQMGPEARRRALLRTVSEPSNIRQLIDLQLTTTREEHYPLSELEMDRFAVRGGIEDGEPEWEEAKVVA